jgi:flagellar biosynthetic protein FliR
MTPLLAEAERLLGFGVIAGLLVLFRVSAAMIVMPGFGQGFVPVRVRLVASLAFALIVLPAVAPDLPKAAGLGVTATLLVNEIACGAALGLFLRLMTMALEIAGMMIAQATSLAQMFGGAETEPMPAISHLLLMAGLALAAFSGLHLRVAEALILSYSAFPAGELPGSAALRDWGLGGVIRAFTLAFGLAAPVLVLATLYNFALGAINRAMPQLMVMMVGAPALTIGVFVVLAVGIPVLLVVWHTEFAAVLSDPFVVRR